MEENVPPGSVCCFCLTPYEDEALYGKFFKIEEITTHYFCLLLSSKVQQRGEDDDGILGFMPEDIRNELRRGKNITCSYCGKRGATISCHQSKCKMHFHLPCGRAKDTFHLFFAEFKSFCCKHRKSQRVKAEVLNAMAGKQSTCAICLESVPATPSVKTLWAPCCSKEAWFHRLCIQRLALSAGYFFKCPLCNNTTQFVEAMRTCGIWIPEQDAAWERDPDRYDGLLQRHNSCDAKSCRCRHGRTFHMENTKWEIKLCADCGSQGMHVYCGNLQVKKDWVCSVCASVPERPAKHRKTTMQISQTHQAVDHNIARRRLPMKPHQRMTRQCILSNSEREANVNVEDQGKMKDQGKTKKEGSQACVSGNPVMATSSAIQETTLTKPLVQVANRSKESTPKRPGTGSQVPIIDVDSSDDDDGDIQHWGVKKSEPLVCACKRSRRSRWPANVFRSVVSCSCNEWNEKYIHNGESSSPSIKNCKNNLLSRFVSTLAAECRAADLRIVILSHFHHPEKNHHVTGSSRSAHTEENSSNVNSSRSQRNRTRSSFVPQEDAKASTLYKLPNKTEQNALTCEGSSNNQESQLITTNTTLMRNSHKYKTERLSGSPTESSSKTYRPRTRSQSRLPMDQTPGSSRDANKYKIKTETKSCSPEGNIRTRSWTRCGRSRKRRSVSAARSCCNEDSVKKSSSCPKKGHRGKRKRLDSHKTYPFNKRGRKPSSHANESKVIKGKEPSINANTSSYSVGDGRALAKLSTFQPVVVLERIHLTSISHICSSAHPPRSPSPNSSSSHSPPSPPPVPTRLRRARSASVERVCDRVVRLKRGRSRKDQFKGGNMRRGRRNLLSPERSGRLLTSSRAKRKPSRIMIQRSPIRTRSRSRSMSECILSPDSDFHHSQIHDANGNSNSTTELLDLRNFFTQKYSSNVTTSESPDGRESPTESVDTSSCNVSSGDDTSSYNVSSGDEIEDECWNIGENYLVNIELLRGDGEVDQHVVQSNVNINKKPLKLSKMCGKNEGKNVFSPVENFPKPSSSFHPQYFSPHSSSVISTCPPHSVSSSLPYSTMSNPSPSSPLADCSTLFDLHPPVLFLSSSSESSQTSSVLSSTHLSVDPSPNTSLVSSVPKNQILSSDLRLVGTASQSSSLPVMSFTQPSPSPSSPSPPPPSPSPIPPLPSLPSPRRSLRSNRTCVPSYNCRTVRKAQFVTSSPRSAWRSSPPPIFPERSGSPTQEECRIKARTLAARKFVPMSRAATEQRAMIRQLQEKSYT